MRKETDSNLTRGTTRPHLFSPAADAHRSYRVRHLSAPLACGLLERMDGEGLLKAGPAMSQTHDRQRPCPACLGEQLGSMPQFRPNLRK